MSDSDPEPKASTLGKRVRDGEAEENDPPLKPIDSGNGAVVEEDDSDDDDVGPMPMPDNGAAAGGVKKKRKGVSLAWCTP